MAFQKCVNFMSNFKTLRLAAACITGFALTTGSAFAAPAGSIETAVNLAEFLRAARTVIANNQKLINDPTIGDKGLTGAVVVRKALKNFRKRTGYEIPINDAAALRTRLLKAQMAAVKEVVDEHQQSINRADIGFKGFVPAVFGRLVNEKFKQKVGQLAEVKVTAPMNLVRNRKARPDIWERENIRKQLSSPTWPKGKLYSEIAKNSGRDAFRVLVPEYYGAGCLSCHGGPKGEMDITGYPKEGGKLGWLGGAISITLFNP